MAKKNIIKQTNSTLTLADRWVHFQARWKIRRNSHRVKPGLYALGSPDQNSPVFVTANYKLSFNELRSALKDVDGYILVLDTKGINVWCAAGKGTFGTDELVYRIKETSLTAVVSHRKLIVPQLGAVGVAAHEVKKQCGFNVEYGPVRAKDLPEYLKSGKATPEMRRIEFSLPDRFVLIPVEVMGVLLPTLIVAFGFFFIFGTMPAIAILTSVFAATVLFPILLPWLPTPNFSTKGFILGGFAALPFAFMSIFNHSNPILWQRIGFALVCLLTLPAVTAFLALNFTGATTFTSKSGVKREMFAYIPKMAWMLGSGLILSLVINLINLF